MQTVFLVTTLNDTDSFEKINNKHKKSCMKILKEYDIQTPVVSSTLELFETMISLKAEFSGMGDQPEFEGNRVTGSLSFAGNLMGSINIHTTENFLRIMTASMLGIEEEEIESKEECNDVILEVCNIIGGNLKSNFNDVGLHCVISTPSITTGRDFGIESMNVDRVEQFNFTCLDHKLFIEIFLKSDDTKDSSSKFAENLSAVDIKKFSKLDIISSTGDTVLELFDKMLSMELEFADTNSLEIEEGASHVGSLSFAGDVTGGVSIQVSDLFARIITARLLGIKEKDIEGSEQVKNAVGEISNIIGGNLKAAFCDSGLKCEISPPAITAGNDFKIETLNMDKYERYAFQYENYNIFIEVCAKIEENLETNKKEDKCTEKTEEIDDKDRRINQENDGSDDNDDIKNSDQNLCEPNLDIILDIPLKMTVELGRTNIEIGKLLKLSPGDAVTLSNLEGEPLDIFANKKLVAKGKVIVQNEKYGICITKIMSRMDRIKSLG